MNRKTFSEWLEEYEKIDPEPLLVLSAPNHFEHRGLHAVAFEGDLGYSTPEVDAHIRWHDRASKRFLGRKQT